MSYACAWTPVQVGQGYCVSGQQHRHRERPGPGRPAPGQRRSRFPQLGGPHRFLAIGEPASLWCRRQRQGEHG